MMEKEKFIQLSKSEAISFYRKHKYRKCNGFFDAKIRGSVNRNMVTWMKEYFHMTEEDIDHIDQEIEDGFTKCPKNLA